MFRKGIFILTCFLSCVLNAQTTGDCAGAIKICTNPNFTISPSGSGSVVEFSATAASSISNPLNSPAGIVPPGGSGCLFAGELNSVWMMIYVQSSGSMEFSMGAGSGPGAQAGCYDWIMWPYSGSGTCGQIQSNSLTPVRCCWNSMCSGGTGIAYPSNIPAGGSTQDYAVPVNVSCGDQFIMCFSNYSSATTFVPLNFFGTASVSCIYSPCITTIEEAKASNRFGLFPNPSLGKYKLEFEGVNFPCRIEVYDAYGNSIKQQEFDKNDPFLDISGQSKGVYFIRVSTEGKEIFKDKLVLE
jgi:hypothetical protein